MKCFERLTAGFFGLSIIADVWFQCSEFLPDEPDDQDLDEPDDQDLEVNPSLTIYPPIKSALSGGFL